VTPCSLVDSIDVLHESAPSSALKTAMVDFRNVSKFVLELTCAVHSSEQYPATDQLVSSVPGVKLIVMLATAVSSTQVSWRWRVTNLGVNMPNARIVPPSLLRSKPFLLQILYHRIQRRVQQSEMLRHHCHHVRDYQAMR